MSFLFWLSLTLLVYPLIFYPLVLALLCACRGMPPSAYAPSAPYVSLILSVYNEAGVIVSKIENFLSLDYPEDKLELLIVSDGSDDGTDALVAERASDRIRLLRQEQRGGKTRALNRAAEEARGEILFFTDADSMLKPDCLRALVAPFADPDVGLASGRSIYRDSKGRETAGSVYRRYEEWIKEREGALSGIAGADGAVYALRKNLYRALPPEYINDLVHPVQVVLEGKKAVARPEALVTEPEAQDTGVFARQTRIMAQSWLIFLKHAKTLGKAGRYGYLWQFVSHKPLRWLALPLMLLLALSAWELPGTLPLLTLAALLALCLFAALGARAGKWGRIARLFMIQSLAGSWGLVRLLRGDTFVTWNPRGN